MVKIVIAGDTCPIGRNEPFFRRGDGDALLGDLRPQFDGADLAIANLECPLIERESPIPKCGPNLGAPVECVNGLKGMGIDVVALANNHIMDHGPQGLRRTIEALDQHNIAHVGAGENLQAARRILVREVEGIRIGILALAEHEFCIAGREEPGANPLDVIDFVRNVNGHGAEYDHLIVLVHGGNEHYRYPRPGLMNTCRFLVEQGADAVICQHSHCTGSMETYQDVPILYGQGNFLFDRHCKVRTWYEAALICLDISEQGHFEFRLIPYCQSDGGPGARKMSRKDEESFLKAFGTRSQAIGNEAFVGNQWESFCDDHKRYYLHSLRGSPGIFRRVMGKLDLLHYLDSRAVQRARLNVTRCESHREALIRVLVSEAQRK